MSKYFYSRKYIRRQITRQLSMIDGDTSAYQQGLEDGLLFAYHLIEKEKN